MSTVRFCRGILTRGIVLRCLKCNCFHHCLSNVLSAHRQGLCAVSECANGASLFSYNLNCIGRFKFFRNLQRYSQLKIHHRCRWHRCRWHRCQTEKIFNKTSFSYFVWQICHQCQWQQRYWWQNLPLVSLILMANLAPVYNSWQRWQICPVSLTPVANLALVSLIPVLHLELQISPPVFRKIQNDPNIIFRDLGEADSWKKTCSKKSCDMVFH